MKYYKEVTSGISLTECPICLTSFNKDDKIVQTICQHHFHSKCLIDWIDTRANCPMCRNALKDIVVQPREMITDAFWIEHQGRIVTYRLQPLSPNITPVDEQWNTIYNELIQRQTREQQYYPITTSTVTGSAANSFPSTYVNVNASIN